MSDAAHETRPVAAGPEPRRGRTPAAVPYLGVFRKGGDDSLERQIYQFIRRAIMSGHLQRGAMLSSRTLASDLGVSAMPVREALKRLEAEGVLITKARSAFHLNDPTVEEYKEIMGIRLRLEGFAARRAAERISDRRLARILRWHRALSGVGRDATKMLSRNFGFHFEIYRAAEHPILLSMIETLWVRIGPSLHWSTEGYDLPRMLETHQRIIDALRHHDPDGAEAALRFDLTSATAEVVRSLGSAT